MKGVFRKWPKIIKAMTTASSLRELSENINGKEIPNNTMWNGT